MLRHEFAALLAHEPGTRLGEDAEELHRMRVATRRLRAAMRLFRDVLPKRAARLREDLAWIADALGQVRDLDVQAERLAEWTARDPRLRAAFDDPALRAEARRNLLETLDSARYRRFVRSFGALLGKGPPARVPAAARPVVAAAPHLVLRLHRKFRTAARRISPQSSPKALHALRIRGKRLRYALEFLEPVYGEAAKDLARRIAGVQDLLGRHQDICVAVDRIERRLAGQDALPRTAAFAMGVVVERCSQEAARLRAELPKTLARAKGRPWHRLRRRMERLTPEDPPKALRPAAIESAPSAAAAVPSLKRRRPR